MRFIRNDMPVATGDNMAVVTEKGVFWKCGACGMKNTPREEGCRVCGMPNF